MPNADARAADDAPAPWLDRSVLRREMPAGLFELPSWRTFGKLLPVPLARGNVQDRPFVMKPGDLNEHRHDRTAVAVRLDQQPLYR